MVAPLVGAWIEIKAYMLAQKEADVAPLVGAWIEIKDDYRRYTEPPSLLSWERGLK